MIRLKALLLLFLFAVCTRPLAASSKNAGTSSAQFLKIGAGARPTAMGDAFVGVADDINAVYYNPAGLAALEKMELMAMHTQYFQGLDYNFGAYAQPTAYGTFGVSASTLRTDELNRHGEDESFNGTFTNQDSAYALSFGHRLGETFSLGYTARWIREEIDTASASAWSGDVGLLKRFEDRPITLGFAVRHFGTEVKFHEEGDPLPLTIDGGVGLRLFDDRLQLAADVRQVRDSGTKFGLGAEWRQNLFGRVRYGFRLGYNSANTDPGGANGTSLGAGLGYRNLDFDVAWIPFGDLGNTFRYAARFKF